MAPRRRVRARYAAGRETADHPGQRSDRLHPGGRSGLSGRSAPDSQRLPARAREARGDRRHAVQLLPVVRAQADKVSEADSESAEQGQVRSALSDTSALHEAWARRHQGPPGPVVQPDRVDG